LGQQEAFDKKGVVGDNQVAASSPSDDRDAQNNHKTVPP